MTVNSKFIIIITISVLCKRKLIKEESFSMSALCIIEMQSIRHNVG